MSKESGVLLHISSLPGKYGIGTLGKEAFKFIDFLKKSGFSYWEVLPLEATGYSNSPYLNCSAFGYNYFLIDLESLIDEGLLTVRDLRGISFGNDPRMVDYLQLFAVKSKVLRIAFKRFDVNNPDFIEFKRDKYRYEYALYATIKEMNNSKAWFDWKIGDRYFDEEVKNYYEKNHATDIEFHFFNQFIFNKQRNKLHEYARSQGIDIIGDLSHFMAYDSDAMYFNPDLFMVDKRNLATYVAGFPPDDFKKEGQKWGYPLYDWNYMKLTNYKWRKSRIYNAQKMYDRVKLNHFRGFKKVYAVPFRAPNAKKGQYLPGPGLEFIKEISNEVNLIASHLGKYSEDIDKFVDESKLPYLKVALTNFYSNEKEYREDLLPSRISSNVYLYLGNHDNMPVREVIKSSSADLKNLAYERLRKEGTKLNVKFDSNFSSAELARYMIELLFASNAEHVTLTMSDMLFSGKEARMNIPGEDSIHNWAYRYLPFEFSDKLSKYYLDMNTKYNRLNTNTKKN